MRERRAFLSRLAGLAAGAALPWPARAPPLRLRWADMHSHHGMVPAKRNPQTTRLADDMRANGLAVAAMKVIADYPVLAYAPGRIDVREARASGQFRAHFERTVAALKARAAREGLGVIAAPADLDRALKAQAPAIAIASEGADFLEGELAYLDKAKAAGLAHLQLIHFRVNECGDTAAMAPVFGGLSAFGRDAIRACNRLGILVDVAHCTQRGVLQALETSTRPLVYSHGWVSEDVPQWDARNARALHAPQARAIAQAGGVVGVFPVYDSIERYAAALKALADAIGTEHAGIGIDLDGLPRPAIRSYRDLPALARALQGQGLREEAVDRIMGGNYLRVLRQALAA